MACSVISTSTIKGEGKSFTPEEEQEWSRVVARFDAVCKLAKEKDVEVLIDAEESWIQSTIDAWTENMMHEFNTEKAIIFNTIHTLCGEFQTYAFIPILGCTRFPEFFRHYF